MPPSKGCVLVVDDDADIRETMGLILESAGYRTLIAANGAAALECLRGGATPSVILLDLMMPVMNGWQFRAEQARDPQLSAIPVVILTGAGQAAEKAATLGAAGCLEKPVELDRLFSAIQRHCGECHPPT